MEPNLIHENKERHAHYCPITIWMVKPNIIEFKAYKENPMCPFEACISYVCYICFWNTIHIHEEAPHDYMRWTLLTSFFFTLFWSYPLIAERERERDWLSFSWIWMSPVTATNYDRKFESSHRMMHTNLYTFSFGSLRPKRVMFMKWEKCDWQRNKKIYIFL